MTELTQFRSGGSLRADSVVFVSASGDGAWNIMVDLKVLDPLFHEFLCFRELYLEKRYRSVVGMFCRWRIVLSV